MNESTCSSKFQTDLRRALPGCEVVKLADKSMIGLVDAFAAYNKKTLFMEYKFICSTTKGVRAEFMHGGGWSPLEVASASPTQFETAKRLATASHCIYLFWALDYAALRKKVAYVTIWHPITQRWAQVKPTDLVAKVCEFFQNHDTGVSSLFSISNQKHT